MIARLVLVACLMLTFNLKWFSGHVACVAWQYHDIQLLTPNNAVLVFFSHTAGGTNKKAKQVSRNISI